MKLEKVLPRVIALADVIRDHWAVELPKLFPDYPFMREGDTEPPPPPERQQLLELLEELSAQEVYTLVVLMYLGEGDYEPANLSAAQDRVRKIYGQPEWAISYMVDTPSLGEYLADGLNILRKHKLRLDSLYPDPITAS